MKKALIILFILFSPATGATLSNADQTTIPKSHELSADRHAQQDGLKHGHSHDVKAKSKYGLKNIDGKRGGDGDKHVHKHGDNHDHKAKSKYDLRNIDRHDRSEAHGHAHARKHDHGDAHKHKQGDAHVHDYGDGRGAHDDHGHKGHTHSADSHDDHGHERHGYDHGHEGHEHGCNRLWDVGISG
jgi:hypothetical protein